MADTPAIYLGLTRHLGLTRLLTGATGKVEFHKMRVEAEGGNSGEM